MARTKKKSTKPGHKAENKVLQKLRVIKNVFFGIILALLVVVVVITLTARINGQTPKIFGHALYRVTSGSMKPFLEIGDIILCSDCDPMQLKKGDIITYDGTTGEFAGRKVTHRVVKEAYLNDADGKYYLITKGDDNPIDDSPILTTQVTGKFDAKIDLIKRLYDFFITPWGLLALIALIVLAFFNEIIIFIKAVRGEDEDEKEDIQEIIERVQRESAGQQKPMPEASGENGSETVSENTEDNAEK